MKSEQEYSDMVRVLAKNGDAIVEDLSGSKAHLLHMVVGIAGESGELLDAIKKYVIYNKELDRENVIEELGDLEFYMQGLRDELQITREETLRHNMNKLSIRYGEKYSDVAAQVREDKIEPESRGL